MEPGSMSVSTTSEVYREDGTALVYRSDVTLMRDGEAVQSGSMTVNNPLTFGDIVFYQSGFGQAVALKVEDSAGQVLFDDALPSGRSSRGSIPTRRPRAWISSRRVSP